MAHYISSLPLPDLPDDIFADIAKRIAIDDIKLLAPILKSGQRGKKIVYRADVLKEASIYSLCKFPPFIYTSYHTSGRLAGPGRYRPFFERCLKAGNKIAIYHEGLRVTAVERDIKRGIALLSQHVPEAEDATLAYAMLSICAGDEDMAVHYLHLFDSNHHPLLSAGVRTCRQGLIRELLKFDTPYSHSFGKTFKYPDGPTIPNPDCALLCCLQFGHHGMLYRDYDIMCLNCYIWWLANKVSELI